MLDLLPYEVLEDIAFWLGNEYSNGDYYPAPSALHALFLTSSTIHDRLLGAPAHGQPANHALLARLYESHFDKDAFERRFRIKLRSSDLAAEYRNRLCALRRIRNCQFPLEEQDQPQFALEDLWTVLLMIYDDEGNNMRQILRAGVEHWAKSIAIVSRYVDENSWPVENVLLRLSFAIVSLLGTVESVLRETPEERERLLMTFQAFLIAPHKYPMTHFPITSSFPHDGSHHTPVNDTLLTMGPISDSVTSDVQHFGWNFRLASPSAAESAFCAVSLRQERREMMVLPNTPENRAAADAQGRSGPTKEDHRENNYHRKLALGSAVPHAGSEQERENLARLPDPLRGSRRFDIDLWRLLSVEWTHAKALPTISRCWYNTVYIPGILVGKWYGRIQMLFWEDFLDMVRVHPAAPYRADLVAQPMQFSLREHVITDCVSMVGCGDSASGNGVRNAWFPDGVDPSQGQGAHETSTGLEIVDPMEPEEAWKRKRYRSYDAGVQLPEGDMPPLPERVYGEEYTGQSSPEQDQIPDDVESDFGAESARQIGPHPDAPDEMMYDYESVPEEGFVDVCITGETDHKYCLAWGAFKVYGRVRKNDGLIMLVRVPVNPAGGQGRWIFSGYLRASTTIVGQWRETGTSMNDVGYAGPFMLTKIGKDWGPPPLSANPPP